MMLGMSWTWHNDLWHMIQVVDVIFCIVAMFTGLFLHQGMFIHCPIRLYACLMLATSTGWLCSCSQMMQFVIYLSLLYISSLTN